MASKLKGLDVQHGDVYKVFPESLVMITDPNDPLYDPRVDLPLVESMVLNIMAMGVKEPLLVTRRDEKYLIVEGRQRYKHAVEANKRLKKAGDPLIRVPFLLERGDEKSHLITMIALNELRQQDEFMTKIVKMRMLFGRGATEEQVANTFGVTVTAIKQWQKIDDAPLVVKRAIEDGKISPSAAAKFAGMGPEKAKEALAKAVAEAKPGKKASVKAVSKAAKKSSGKEDEGAFISIKMVKRVIHELEKKGNECSIKEHHFLEGLKFCLGLVEAENLCFTSQEVRIATGLEEPPAAEEEFAVEGAAAAAKK